MSWSAWWSGAPVTGRCPTSSPAPFPSRFESPEPGLRGSEPPLAQPERHLGRALLGLGSTRDSVRALRRICHELRPDLILNFFEPLTGLAQLLEPLPAPVVSIAHQSGRSSIRLPVAGGSASTSSASSGSSGWWATHRGSSRSLAPDEDLDGQRLVVGPPLLRETLFEQMPRDDGYYLVYLLNHGYADDIREWQRRHPDVSLHCFYDKPGAPDEERASAGLTFHRLDGEKFLRLMAGCRAVVCTAGFESVSEALWLGKPLFLVPVEHHVEQALNAVEAERLGLGIADRSFALDRLAELPAEVPSGPFRRWVETADACLNRVIGRAVAEHRLRVGVSAAA
ncbi:MAG: glycosyltransferase family protein [Gemmatimonadales bacterium]